MSSYSLRELSNYNSAWDLKDRRSTSGLSNQPLGGAAVYDSARSRSESISAAGGSAPHSARNGYQAASIAPLPTAPTTRFSTGGSVMASPGFDRQQHQNPPMCGDIAKDIIDMFHLREQSMNRDYTYIDTVQNEVTEKMRTILVDWLVDVHLKFKLHPETLFLAVDIVDRFLAAQKVTRAQLQLVGITAMLLAAKYEEIWPPEVKECLNISANTYTRDELLKMERDITAALKFKLTVPTCYPFLARLLETTEADETTRNAALFFMEHAAQDYKQLGFRPSQIACASMYLANLLLRKSDPWNYTLQHYSRARVTDFAKSAAMLLEYVHQSSGSKYQAIRRKYNTPKYYEISRMALPTEIPVNFEL